MGQTMPPPPAQPPGWYPNGNTLRYWDGGGWTDQTAPLAPAPAAPVPVVMAPGPAVWQPPRTNHTLHLLLTVLTCGLWSIVWGGVALAPAGGPRLDAFGRPVPASRNARIVGAVVGALVFVMLIVGMVRASTDHTAAVEQACRQSLIGARLVPSLVGGEEAVSDGDKWSVAEQVITSTGATTRYVCHVVWTGGAASVADVGPG